VPSSRISGFGAVAIAKGVELLDVAQGQLGLLGHPGPQAYLEGAMLRLQGT
jgi:hypothetical protein